LGQDQGLHLECGDRTYPLCFPQPRKRRRQRRFGRFQGCGQTTSLVPHTLCTNRLTQTQKHLLFGEPVFDSNRALHVFTLSLASVE
jgi:hypothetical protein